ncbi:MAG: hypothetical protein ACYS29_09580, partial [Planctomycetota bacterium]
LKTEPGLHVLTYRMPSASVTTLELLIPEENLKVDVEPMLAATTSQVEAEGAKATRLQAFLGSAEQVRLSWKPKTEAAPQLKPVIICEQFQHINVGEALISYEIRLDYTIRRGGVDSFTVKLPGQFRVTDLSGANIAKWSIVPDVEPPGPAGQGRTAQELQVSLFSPAKDRYSLAVTMELFLQEAQAEVPLVPVVTDGVLRRSGLIGVTASPRRLVGVKDLSNLARVDTGRLPQHLQNQPGVTAYRFIAADYGGTIAIATALPRITVNQRWMLGVDSDQLELQGRIHYKVERSGIFELTMNLPEPWKIDLVGPDSLVDDHQVQGSGPARVLHILLRAEKAGEFELQLAARAERAQPELGVDFRLPLAGAENLQLYQGQLTLLLADQLRAEVEQLGQLQAIPLGQAQQWARMPGLSAVMAFEFRAIDRAQPAGATFRIAVKPPQVSAVVHRMVNIQRGSIEQEAIVDYRVRYAPIDTFYLKMPKMLDDAGVQITGDNIKEKPRIEQLPPDQRGDAQPGQTEGPEWAYYKIVLQSEVIGDYRLKVHTRRSFQAGEVGQPTTVEVMPILAAGKLSDQNGRIAISKAEMLAIGQPQVANLVAADPGSEVDLPYEPHRRVASLAFKYNAPPFELSLPVVMQKEAIVFTTIVSGAIIEQVLARDGVLNTHATFLLQTGKGDRLPISLPPEAELTAVLLNGDEAPVEMGLAENERIVRLPHSAGQVSKFVLEISYGLRNVSQSDLAAPRLPEQTPVQQTLWRLWIPRDYCLLRHSRVFSRLELTAANEMQRILSSGQPSPVGFKPSGQGKVFDFVRQGAPGRLSVMVMGKETFSIIVWVLIIAAGVLMLKVSGWHRILAVLAVLLLAGILSLYLPLMIHRAVGVGVFAAILVFALWVAQWLFLRLPTIRQVLPALAGPQAKPVEPPPSAEQQQSGQDKE